MPKVIREHAVIDYHYDPVENARIVTLVNGFARSSGDFRSLDRFLKQHGFARLLINNRGVGGSTSDECFSIEDMAKDVEYLWEHLGIKQSDILGISMGGLIAMVLARRCPNIVQRMILVSTFAKFSAASFEEKSNIPIEVELEKYFGHQFLQKNRGLFEAFVKQMKELRQNADQYQQMLLAWQRRAINRFDATAWLPNLSQRVLIMHGCVDQIVSPDSARYLKSQLSHSELLWIPNAGHLLLVEAPDKFKKAVLLFFQPRI